MVKKTKKKIVKKPAKKVAAKKAAPKKLSSEAQAIETLVELIRVTSTVIPNDVDRAIEKAKGVEMSHQIDNDLRGGRAEVIIVSELPAACALHSSCSRGLWRWKVANNLCVFLPPQMMTRRRQPSSGTYLARRARCRSRLRAGATRPWRRRWCGRWCCCACRMAPGRRSPCRPSLGTRPAGTRSRR